MKAPSYLLLAAIIGACGSPAPPNDDDEEPSLVLTVDHVEQTREISTSIAPAGARFVVVGFELRNNRAEPQPLDAARFSVETTEGLALTSSASSALTGEPCPAGTSVKKGGSYGCEVAFDVADAQTPNALLYETTSGRTLSAALELPACSWCGTHCVDLQSDSQHCGGCNAAVGPAQECVGGAPACADSALTLCDGSCVDLAQSSQHCGGCGMAVGSGKLCSGGQPQCANASFTDCGPMCADLTDDDDNCGQCGRACPAGGDCGKGGTQCSLQKSSSDETKSCGQICGSLGYDCVGGVAYYASFGEPGNPSYSAGCSEPPPASHPNEYGFYYHSHYCTCSLTF